MKPMQSTVDAITLTEYHPDLAAEVADMWNNSREGWGGHNNIKTAEQVRIEEENSTNLKLFLALDGDKVVGYCSFGEYREDDGALYIPLLNVRTDYHGKKVGKKLVLRAVEEAIKMNWPRLDLYTWPGNTKAVPLYKKCGFFWEDRDDSTHLMNFMPTVLNTELVQEFFKDVNWYDVSTRKIEVKPDGRKENDYQYYQYSWEANSNSLTMEFEKSARGLRLIETNDFYISATIHDFEPVFGNAYTIEYKIKNKTGIPLNINLNGMDDKNIKFDLNQTLVVEDELTLEAPFYVGEIKEEQDDFRAHPAVITEILVNGKKAVFKVGVKPKFPAKIDTKTPENVTYIGSSSKLFIDITNNFKQDVTYSFTLPENEYVDFMNSTISVKLAAKEQKSIAVPYTLKKHGFFKEEISINAVRTDGNSIKFTKSIHAIFKGFGAAFSGECDEYYHIYNGKYQVRLFKFNNAISPGTVHKERQKSFFMYPKLGRPYSDELSKLKPEKVEFQHELGTISMKATYRLVQQKGIKLHTVTKLYSEGLVEQHYEVENTNVDETVEQMWLNTPVFHLLDRAVIPYQGKLVEMNDSIGSFHSNWNGANVTENWIYSRDSDEPRGLCWAMDDQVQFGSWFAFFEHALGKIPAGKTVKTNKLYLSIGAFQDWKSFREFALQKKVDHGQLTNNLEFKLNGQNPIVNGLIEGSIKDYKASFLDGEMALYLDGEAVYTDILSAEQQISESNFKLNIPQDKKIGVLRAELNLDSGSVERQTLFLNKSNEEIKNGIEVLSGHEVNVVDNGALKLKASADYSPGLFALEYSGDNWLDNAFPTPRPKAWWNPWTGGFMNRLVAISPNSLLKEKTKVTFTKVNDSYQNTWEGLKVSVKMEEHQEYKGLAFHQYYLLLPGLPVMCHFTEIHQNSSQFLQLQTWETSSFLKVRDMKDTWMQFQSPNGEWQKIYGGKSETEMNVYRNVAIGSNHSNQKLQVITDLGKVHLDTYINREVMALSIEEKLNLEDGAIHFTTPTFFIFTDEVISDQAFTDLLRIRFV